MATSLHELIKKTKGGYEEALLEILFRFKPAIVKFSRILGYPEAESDLVISLIELIKSINIENFSPCNDGLIVSYIYHSLDNKKIDLFRKYTLKYREDFDINLEILPDMKCSEAYEQIFVKDILRPLPDLQREIIEKKFLLGFSDIEIADCLHISRQAVNRTKNRALSTLRKLIASQKLP